MKCTMCEKKQAKYKAAVLCESCYQFVYYWKNKSVTALMKRRETLGRWTARTEKLMPARVTSIRRKRKAASR